MKDLDHPGISSAVSGASLPAPDAEPSAALNEPLLPDDYAIFADYLYVADGRPVRSDWHGITAREFKAREGYAELRRCDIHGRRRLAEASSERSVPAREGE